MIEIISLCGESASSKTKWFINSIGDTTISIRVEKDNLIIESIESALEYLTRAKRLKNLMEIKALIKKIDRDIDIEIEKTYYGDF